jgi:hypothetical protein
MHDAAYRVGRSTIRRYETRHGHIRSETQFSFVTVLYINFFCINGLADKQHGIGGPWKGATKSLV